MTVIEMECACCHKPIQLTKTASLFKTNGSAYRIFCGTCYPHLKEAK